jgi:16S rRNA (uracil1498-N3)-methyltransferase
VAAVTVPRLHTAQPLAAGATLAVEGERAHYLRNVLRLPEGAAVRPFNGDDGEWRGRLVALGRRRLEIAIEERLRPPAPEPGPSLVFAPIRRNRLDWLVEKAVELGVGRLTPVLTRRTVARPDKADRLEAIAVEAAEQCGRLTVPPIDPPCAFPAWLAERDAGVPLLHADERGGGVPILEAARRWPGAQVLVGPEGGFADKEVALLRSAPLTVAVSLGHLILRAETAALYALAAWQLGRDGG